MLILSQIYFLILIYWIKAQKIEQCETSIDDQNKEINSRLNNAIKLQDIYERRIDEMVKLFSGIIDKLYDINKKTCLTDKIAFERYDKNTEKGVNKMKSPDKYPSKSSNSTNSFMKVLLIVLLLIKVLLLETQLTLRTKVY